MDEEKRKIESYTVEQSIYIGDKEVLFCVDQTKDSPYMVCFCSYDNPLSVPWPFDGVCTDDYLEGMREFTDRVQAQIELVRTEQKKYEFDMTPLTIDQCIPDHRDENIVGKVVVIDSQKQRYEYQHCAYQLVLVDGGNGAMGGRGQAVFGTCLSDGLRGRWERYDVLGQIKPEYMPEWAEKALAGLQEQVDADEQPDQDEPQEFTPRL